MEFVKSKLGLVPNKENNILSDDNERLKIECNGRAYLYGLVVGPLTFSVVYFTQKFFTKNIKVRNEPRYERYDMALTGYRQSMQPYIM